MMHVDDIGDNEIRIIGQKEPPKKPSGRRWLWVVLSAALIAIVVTVVMLARPKEKADNEETQKATQPATVAPTIVKTDPAEVIVTDTVVNDVAMGVYSPVNALPELMVGKIDPSDTSVVLALQAADIRADNGGIVGAFVLNGELISRGSAKKGFCAIINNRISIGVAESTSLLEEAIDNNGYFFRQYPLVDEYVMQESKLKNKAIRRALCNLDGKVSVVCSKNRESMHDFAQALADLGVRSAIYLVGSQAHGFYRTRNADNELELVEWNNPVSDKMSNHLNYILWKSM